MTTEEITAGQEQQEGQQEEITNGLNGAKADEGADGEQEGQQGASADEGQEEENDLIGKPEAYTTDDIELPEGVELDQDLMKSFTEKAEKLNLSQKGYNEFIKYGIDILQKSQSQMQEAFKQQEVAKINGYKRAALADKEIGGSVANIDKACKEAILAYDRFASDELKQVLGDTGLEYHPAVIKLFRDISSQMQDDTFKGNSDNKAELKGDVAARMYPNM